MALNKDALTKLAPYLRGASVLSLGYPDILASAEECHELFGVEAKVVSGTGEQHGIKRDLVETMDLMAMIGAKFECVDVQRWRGHERVCDLNEPQDLGKFDLVIDPGTTEHCFNIGQAVKNAASAVKVGGHIYHGSPMTMINHGFYNICPTMLWDFYEQNGWKIVMMEARSTHTVGGKAINSIFARTRIATVSPESSIICMAQRRTDAALIWPMQEKYRKLLKDRKAA